MIGRSCPSLVNQFDRNVVLLEVHARKRTLFLLVVSKLDIAQIIDDDAHTLADQALAQILLRLEIQTLQRRLLGLLVLLLVGGFVIHLGALFLEN